MEDRQIHELMQIAAKRFSFDTDIEVVGRIAKLLQSECLKLRLDNDSADIRAAEWRYQVRIHEAVDALRELVEVLDSEAEYFAEHRIESFKKENA